MGIKAKQISDQVFSLNEQLKDKGLVKRYALLLAIVACCIYANTLQNSFVFDDLVAIEKNGLVKKGIYAIPEILSSPYHEGVYKEMKISYADNLYRPLSIVMFAVEYHLFGDNPLPGHLVNITLYAGCCVLLFLFLYHLFKKKRLVTSFIASLLFALHPIHTEVVANIKSRDELLCFFFGLLSLNTFIKYPEAKSIMPLIGGLIFYFLSLFSKETSITFLAVIPLVFFFYRNENKKRSIQISLLSLAIALAYLFIRNSVLTSPHTYEIAEVNFINNPLIAAPSPASRIATIMLIMGQYIKLLVVPYPLICDYGYNTIPFTNFSDIRVVLSSIVYLFFLCLGIYRLIKKPADPLAFGILFFLITISIFSNIFILLASEMSERFLFFPSVGFCVVAAFAIERFAFRNDVSEMAELKNKALFFLIPIAVFFIVLTIQRNMEWKDDLTLFSKDSKKSPDNFRLSHFAGNEKIIVANNEDADPSIRQEMLKEGIIDLQRSLAIYPENPEAHIQLTLAFTTLKQPDSAEAHCKAALLLNPTDTASQIRLANIYANNRKYSDAMNLLKKISAVNPDNPYYLYNIGICNFYMKQHDSAVYYIRKTLAIDPAYGKAHYLIAVIFNTMGQKDSAKKYEAIVKQTNPGFDVEKVLLPK